jgi:putative endonuclease
MPGLFFCRVTYRVYIIKNPNGRHYIGLSEDPSCRLQQHNEGVSKWTKDKGPWHLIWTSEAMSLSDARKLENLLKRQKGGSGFYRITGLSAPQAHNPAAAHGRQLKASCLKVR